MIIFFVLLISQACGYGIMEISQMDCSLPYYIDKGHKAMKLEILGLHSDITVIISDQEINVEHCNNSYLNTDFLCQESSYYCKSRFFCLSCHFPIFKAFSNKTTIKLELPQCWIKKLFLYFHAKDTSLNSGVKVVYERVVSG